MVALRQPLFGDRPVGQELDKVHLLRQVDVAPRGVLRVDGRDHHLVAQHQLVLHLRGERVVRVDEGQRFEQHVAAQRGFHVLAVQVGQQPVAHADDMAEILRLLKLVELLPADAGARVVAHQRHKHGQFQPAQQQVARGVAAKAADVRADVQKAAHIQRGQHLQVQQNMRPPGAVVPGPDAAVAVHADVGRAREQQNALLRAQPGERLGGRARHVVAVQVVHGVVAHHLPADVVVEPRVVFFAAGQPRPLLRHAQQGHVAALGQGFAVGLGQVVQPLLGVEDRRLVHVVPEPVDAGVQQHAVLPAEPGAGFGVEHVGEMRPPRPHGGREQAAVGVAAEIPLFDAFLVHGVAVLHLDAGVDDGHQVDVLALHLGHKRREIGEVFAVDRKVLVVLHVVDVHVQHVQRHMGVAVFFCYRAEIFWRLVAPAALAVTEREFGRDVAAPDDAAELPHDVIRRPTVDDIEVEVGAFAINVQRVLPRVADVERQAGRAVHKHAKAGRTGHHHKVVRAVQRALVLHMVAVVGGKADVFIAALVDAAHRFAQAVDDVAGPQRAGEGKAAGRIHRAVGAGLAAKGQVGRHGFGLKRGAKFVFAYHTGTSLPGKCIICIILPKP